jgi:hypothetical protein
MSINPDGILYILSMFNNSSSHNSKFDTVATKFNQLSGRVREISFHLINHHTSIKSYLDQIEIMMSSLLDSFFMDLWQSLKVDACALELHSDHACRHTSDDMVQPMVISNVSVIPHKKYSPRAAASGATTQRRAVCSSSSSSPKLRYTKSRSCPSLGRLSPLDQKCNDDTTPSYKRHLHGPSIWPTRDIPPKAPSRASSINNMLRLIPTFGDWPAPIS